MSLFRKLFIWGELSGETAKVTNGGLDINIQDQYTDIINLYFHNERVVSAPAATVTKGANSFTLPTTANAVVGEIACFQEGNHFFQAFVLANTTGSPNDTITIDSPFDFAFTTEGVVTIGSAEMNVDGSTTPVEFSISPKNLTDGQEWDIVRCIWNMTDETSMDDSKFGGIPALTNGMVFRVEDGNHKHIFNVKSNGDFRLQVYDVTYSDKAPAGFYGFGCRRTFGGQSKNGVTIRLTAITNDKLKIIIQDDLSGLNSFKAVVQGHVVE